ncbi:MAG: aldo/keto reductase, partial [Spirochaetaceae bacterium]|nr:aldo/keto reductase [Spirochaetaceae bacterium]
RIMDYALDKGMCFFDTAEAYGKGESERVIGGWLKDRGNRSKITIGSKCLPPYSAKKIIQSCEDSLKRLKISEIDLFQFHSFDSTALEEEAVLAMEKLIQMGRIRYTGVSNFNIKQLEEYLAIQERLNQNNLCSIQNNHNLAIQNLNNEMMEFCRKKHIGTISYSPLAAGFLTGKYKSSIPVGARFDLQPGHKDVYFNNDSFKALEKLEVLSEETGKTNVDIALKWVLKNPDITTTLVGGRKISHIEQALQALV